jgi:xanthine/CO dehydrogenase XdhC/CoxF family maturation factor
VLATLRAEGMPAEQLARVHGPVGLALGGTAPAEIALEIMAELLKWRRQSTGQERSARLRRRLLRPEAPASG